MHISSSFGVAVFNFFVLRKHKKQAVLLMWVIWKLVFVSFGFHCKVVEISGLIVLRWCFPEDQTRDDLRYCIDEYFKFLIVFCIHIFY